jgi:hypothetical protein
MLNWNPKSRLLKMIIMKNIWKNFGSYADNMNWCALIVADWIFHKKDFTKKTNFSALIPFQMFDKIVIDTSMNFAPFTTLLLLALSSIPTQAATRKVTNLADSGLGTLREAIGLSLNGALLKSMLKGIHEPLSSHFLCQET